MSTGKVRTLFTDKTQTEALFPKTKISAVSDNEGVGLEAILSQMVSAGDNLAQTSSETINADTLNGMSSDDFASKSDVTDVIYAYEKNIDSVIAPVDADTLGGYPAEDYATQVYVKNEIANAQLGGGSGEGEIDLSGFATKDDIANLNLTIQNIDFPVDSVNGKTGTVTLNASDVGARPSNWTPSAADVGAASASHDHSGTLVKPYGIELTPLSSSENHGGFIDFHYNRNSSDYTSRIWEPESGKLKLEGNLHLSGQLMNARKILWQNASPDSGFGSQTISLTNYINYNILLIVAKAHKTSGNTNTLVTVAIPNQQGGIHSKILYSDTNEQHIVRAYQWNSSGIFFENAAYQQGTALFTHNDFAIPIAIYGI